MSDLSFTEKLRQLADRNEQYLSTWLPESEEPKTLYNAMRYSVLGGGKRIRPVLVYATGQALGAQLSALDGPAAAVECIHAYSLVHDDLPAMDDDDLRRGKPTCHIKFDEATAILAGDALQTMAFTILCQDQHITVEPKLRLRMIESLALASGPQGMVGGQAIDMESVGKQLNRSELENMHAHKTGALIMASVELGAYAAGLKTEPLLARLRDYARCIGLAFQVRDDILDIEGDTQVIGKTQGADQRRNKPTYPALLGLDGAKAVARELHEQAIENLSEFGEEANTLREISSYIVSRSQ